MHASEKHVEHPQAHPKSQKDFYSSHGILFTLLLPLMLCYSMKEKKNGEN